MMEDLKKGYTTIVISLFNRLRKNTKDLFEIEEVLEGKGVEYIKINRFR